MVLNVDFDLAQVDDTELLRRFSRENERRAFDELHRRHHENLILILSKQGFRNNAEDLAQQAWIRAMKNAERFDPKKASFATWLNVSAFRLGLDLRRKQKVRKSASLSDAPYLAGSDDKSITAGLIAEDRHRLLEKALDSLPEEQKAAIVLECHGYQYQEIADLLEIPLGTVKSRINAAREKLRHNPHARRAYGIEPLETLEAA